MKTPYCTKILTALLAGTIWAAPALAQDAHKHAAPEKSGDGAKAAAAYTVKIKPTPEIIEAGKPVQLVFAMKDAPGKAVKHFDIVHEKPLHLIMVSKDLSWFAHEHPTANPDGTFSFAFTFPAGGEYTLFSDFTPAGGGLQVVPTTLAVTGTAPTATALAPDADKPAAVEGYSVALNTGGPVTIGGSTAMSYTINRDGKPVTDLQPYLGAMGHLVIISDGRAEYVHAHPAEHGGHSHDPKAPMTGGPTVRFDAHFTKPGLYKSWAQFQRGGQVFTVPFTFKVRAATKPGAAADVDHKGEHDHK